MHAPTSPHVGRLPLAQPSRPPSWASCASLAAESCTAWAMHSHREKAVKVVATTGTPRCPGPAAHAGSLRFQHSLPEGSRNPHLGRCGGLPSRSLPFRGRAVFRESMESRSGRCAPNAAKKWPGAAFGRSGFGVTCGCEQARLLGLHNFLPAHGPPRCRS